MMLFPNIDFSCADGSVQSPFEDRELGFTSVGRDRICQDGEYIDWPVVNVCTATNQEIADRMEGGEFSGDVIDEHTSYLFFRDRDSFRMAWSLARRICSGTKFPWIPAGEVVDISAIEFERRGQREIVQTPGLFVKLSAQHVAEAA